MAGIIFMDGFLTTPYSNAVNSAYLWNYRGHNGLRRPTLGQAGPANAWEMQPLPPADAPGILG